MTTWLGHLHFCLQLGRRRQTEFSFHLLLLFPPPQSSDHRLPERHLHATLGDWRLCTVTRNLTARSYRTVSRLYALDLLSTPGFGPSKVRPVWVERSRSVPFLTRFLAFFFVPLLTFLAQVQWHGGNRKVKPPLNHVQIVSGFVVHV